MKNEPLDFTKKMMRLKMEENEPLKGKKMVMIEARLIGKCEVHKNIVIIGAEPLPASEFFYADCVKSAVLGLLEEIEAKKREIDASLSAILNKTKKDTAVNRGALYGWGEALFWAEGKIKKWFADVL